jgi:hypothetical protein
MTKLRVTPYDDCYFPTATAAGPASVSYPIPQQPGALLYSQPHVQTYAAYVAPAFSSTMPGNAGAYFVGDQNVNREGEFLVTFVRQWATVPAFYNDFETYGYVYPAYIPSSAPGTPGSITGISRSGSNDVISSTVGSVVANDVVFVNAVFTNDGRTYTQSGYAKVVSVSAGVSVTVARFFVGTSATFSSVSGSIVEAPQGRITPTSFAVSSRLLNEFLYTTDPQTDLPIAQPFQAINTSGYPVTFLSTGSATNPNSATYAGLVANRGELIIEASIARYMGNIWNRVTRFVPAL